MCSLRQQLRKLKRRMKNCSKNRTPTPWQLFWIKVIGLKKKKKHKYFHPTPTTKNSLRSKGQKQTQKKPLQANEAKYWTALLWLKKNRDEKETKEGREEEVEQGLRVRGKGWVKGKTHWSRSSGIAGQRSRSYQQAPSSRACKDWPVGWLTGWPTDWQGEGKGFERVKCQSFIY